MFSGNVMKSMRAKTKKTECERRTNEMEWSIDSDSVWKESNGMKTKSQNEIVNRKSREIINETLRANCLYIYEYICFFILK